MDEFSKSKQAPDPSHDEPGAKPARAGGEETDVERLLERVIALQMSELRLALDVWRQR